MRKPGAKTRSALDTETHAHTCTGVCMDTHAHNKHHTGSTAGKGDGSTCVLKVGAGLGLKQGPGCCLLSQLQAQSVGLPEVTQQDGQLETYAVGLTLPTPGRPSLNQASSGLGCPPPLSSIPLTLPAWTSSSLCSQAAPVGTQGRQRWDGWNRVLLNLHPRHPIRQPLHIGSYLS